VFDQQAAARPDAVAIECGEQRWTYAEIAAASRCFAADLQRAGVRPGAIVGIGIGRSVEFVIAVLAVLRNGAAYAPLPIDDPVERLASMVDSAGVTAIVTAGNDEACSPLLRARPGITRVPLGRHFVDAELDSMAGREEPACDPEDPAYVMFTSGSTGTPKGVVVPHRAVVGLVTGQTYADFGPELRTLMAAPTAFDASTFELWGPLLNGGTVVIYPDRYFELHRFGEVVQAGRITCLWLTAGLFNRVIDLAPETLSPVPHVLTGGDVLSVMHVRRAFEALPGIRLTNGYGPTETTTFACTQVIDPADTFPHGSVPIGRPLAHTSCLIMSADGQIVSDGKPGELWIGGSGVAKGYLTLSEGRFVADPRPDGGGGRMYRSGDLCRRLPDGSILFVERMDQQVKIRGHRVEPGEIENTLLKHSAVQAVAVLPFRHDGETALVAFVARRDGSLQPIDGLRAWLKGRLPPAFVPARLVPIDALPVNTNGKVDRTALLALLEECETDGRVEPPRPGTESRVASLWHALLRRQARGRDDDFFTLGGHSLLAMRLMAAIEREFRVRLPVTTVFETRTVSRLAAVIDAAVADGTGSMAAGGFTAAPPIPPTEDRIFPALPAQRGMWLLDALLPDRATYNEPFAFRPDGPIDWERFQETLFRTMTRHPALRSALEADDGGPVQRVLSIDRVSVPWSVEPGVDKTGIEAALRAHARIPFELATAPLWRATLFPQAAPHGILLLTFHHAIIDDWSIELLVREFARQAEEKSEGARPAAAESDLGLPCLGPADRDRCARFWRKTLADATGELPWPGLSSPWDGGPAGETHRFGVDGDVSAALQAISRETGATFFQILLAAFHGWLHRVSGADDIVVGTPVSLRSTPEIQESVNCFLNTLPVRVCWDDVGDSQKSFLALVRQVGETFLAAVSHGKLPFDEIVAAATAERSGERPPIVKTLFVHTSQGLVRACLEGVQSDPVPVDTGTAKVDLTLFLEGDGTALRGAFEYDRRRFDPETISRYAASFSIFLRSVLSTPTEPVVRASLLAARLPAAMIPLRIGVHESLPLTPNGKLDRHSLERNPLPERAEVAADVTDERPLDGAEQAIAELWLAVLGRGVPRRHDDFFHAGGTSLSAMRLVARARERFGINASVRNVFDHPTVAALAAHWLGAAPVPLADAARSPTVSASGDATTVPALPAQRAMWFLQTLLSDRATYNLPHAFRPDGPIDWDRFRAALHQVTARHPALRTSLEAGDDGPIQRIAPVEKVPVPWSEEPFVDETAIEAALRAHARIPFELATAPLWRATLFPQAAPHGVLLLNFHHAIIDDWSIEVCLADLGRAYVSPESSGTLNASTAFAPMAVPAIAGTLDPIADKNFWTAELTGIPDGVHWPGVIAHAGAATSRGETRRFRLDGSVAEAWRGIAREADATLFSALFAAFHAWVHRLTGSEDTVIATPVAGRGVEGLEEAVGCFLNTLPIRVRWGGDPALAQGSAVAAIRRVRDTFLTALDHGQLPFDEIVTSVPGRQAGRRHPVTNVMFVFLEPTDPTWTIGPTRMEKVDVDTGTSRFDLTLSLVAGSDGIEGTVEYSTDVLVSADVERLVTGFISLLGAVAADPGVAIRDIDLLAVDERRQVLHDFNATATDLGPPATLQELFSAQVCRTPAAVALESGNEILSYAELACRVNRLARFLRSRGVGRDVPVAVCMERSVEMVVALLGIVTAGGAYLPLDPEYPTVRIGAMLASASAPVVLVQERFRDQVAGAIGGSGDEVFQVDAQRQELAAFDDRPLDDIATPDDLAYVIYTSGSTGVPKGVMNTHAGIVNRLRWMQDAYRIGASDRVLQKTPFGFDVSVWEFFWPLLTGARIVMAPPGLHREPTALADLVEAAGITVIHFVPSMLDVFLDVPDLERSCRSLRHVFASGEALGEAAMSHCLRRIPARLHNLYGPTEAAVDVTYHECRTNDPPGPVPIGRPIANMRTYVLDAALRPVGVGIDGELWLAGVGVARGYLGRPDLTAERFRSDPFFERPGERMYRTGDLARWRHDGEIEYLGRLDHQVKIRGVRIELGEIEAELERIEGVTRGVVIDREFGPGDRRLVAYLIAEPSAPNDEALKVLLAERLPETMVPWRIVRVDALPVSANGKLDRAALPSPDAAVDAVEASPRCAPVGEAEEALAAIWCELLGIPTVGRDDGFFASGGHSLLSMRLVAAIERRFGVRLPVKTVFESPKLAELAARISQPPAALPESAVALTTIPASAEVIDCRPLPAQRGMWLLHSLLPDPATYNVPIAWRVDGPIDWPRMERSLAAVVARHPALRTALVEVDGDLVQRVLPTAAVAVPWRVVTIAEESGLQAALEHEASTPFDLAIAPLLRAVRIDIAGAEPVLMLTFHHAIIDEWSIGIVRADLAAAYAAADAFDDRSLPVVTSARDSVDIERDRRFWREELAAAPAETPLPGRAVAAVVESSRGRTSRFTVERDALDRLRGLAERSGVTVFNVLLATVHAWLQRITGQRDLVIGTPVATRGAAETTAAVGCLINVLPVRVRFDEGTSADPLTLPGLAERVQGIFLRALDHADLPFDQIVAAAMPTRQGSRQPLVNVLLTVVETGDRAWRIGAATLRPEPIDAGRARFDLSLTLEIGPDGLEGALEFPPDRYDADVVAGLAARYAALLAEAAARPTMPIHRMAMLPDADRRQVIEEFNETDIDLGRATTLHHLVLEQTARTPSACAVREGETQVTYEGLQQRSAQLARRLRGLGIGSGDRVGIALPRSIDATVAMLAVLRSGAAWVPLDREAPPARLAFIVDDAQLSAIIDSNQSSGGWPEGMVVIDPEAADLGDRAEDDLPDVESGAAAYVMYTSGSTGQPKGVVIPHAAVVNYLRGKQRRFPLDAADICLHATRTTFDISVYEVFGPLLAGASLVVLPAGRTDPVRIAELVRSAAVTVAQFVPSLLALLVDDKSFTACPTLRRVFCGGEAMPSGLMERFIDRSDAELVNVYGPTEATVWATAWVCRRSERAEMPPIGRPLDNVRCYVLDAGCRPVPVGTVGELFIGGAQLAIGYHNRPDLTAARFLPDPFLPGQGERMYRTGDVCRWRPDGLLEFVARNDTQVKIRGHRIEPAEIEACLAGHPQIGAVAVVAITPVMAVMPVMADGTSSLVAAVVPRESGLDIDTLRRWTAERLPEVMVPSRFVCLDALPVNANGKIDRRALASQIAESPVALPVPHPQAAGSPGVLPVFLSQVRAAWQRLFGRVEFGDQDNFFHDLGGQSIMAARLVADLSTVLGRRVPLAAVFEAPTVASMAALLRDEGWTPRFRSIVPLQPLGVGPPLFLFHGVGGGVTENLELARAFAPDVPVYGLQAIDRDGGEMQTSLEAFAELYAAEIVAFQPRGPYFLGGFSLGGWFAYETAQQLRRGGHEVALLAQFDTHINCLLPDEVLAAADRDLWRQYVGKHLRRLASQPAQGWRYLRGLPARFKLARQWRAVDPIRGDSHGALVARHRALPYGGQVDYFQAAESLPAVLGVWKRWCAGGLTVHQIPGDHHKVMFRANAATIANIVRGIREDRARQTGSQAEPAERRQV
jgi:amino acid adenylation domain-containing protein